MDKLLEAKKVFDDEIEALEKTRDSIDQEYLKALDLITSCKGKVIVTGIGKSGHIAGKIVATFASLGTPSFYLHPAEAMHGDLGMVSANDIIIAISFSGESEEILKILPNIKIIGAVIIGLTGNSNSTLARISDVKLVLPKFDEACCLGLAPTSSTTATLCYGDSLAVVASKIYSFNVSNFALFHPAGSIGKKLLLCAKDVMIEAKDSAVVDLNISLKDAIISMSRKGASMVTALDDSGKVAGILTDGDLRRLLEAKSDIYSLEFKNVMTKNPFIVYGNELAVNVLKSLKQRRILAVPVINHDKNFIGTVTLHSIIKTGIYL